MKITATGDRLSVLITSDYSVHHDWLAFSAWYSVYRAMPDAAVALLCSRGMKDGQVAYNWPYRCDIRFLQHKNFGREQSCLPLNKLYAIWVALKDGLSGQPLMVIDHDLVALRSFSAETVERLNNDAMRFAVSGPVWYFKDLSLERFAAVLHRHEDFAAETDGHARVMSMLAAELGEPEAIPELCSDCCSLEPTTFVQCGDRCGKFVKASWMKERFGPPFGFAAELTGLNASVNERQVLKLWEQMRIVYDVLR